MENAVGWLLVSKTGHYTSIMLPTKYCYQSNSRGEWNLPTRFELGVNWGPWKDSGWILGVPPEFTGVGK